MRSWTIGQRCSPSHACCWIIWTCSGCHDLSHQACSTIRSRPRASLLVSCDNVAVTGHCVSRSASACVEFAQAIRHWRWPYCFISVGQPSGVNLVPLELYFEHRNYLPAMLMFWPLALWACGVPNCGRRARVNTGKTAAGQSMGTLQNCATLIAVWVPMTHARAKSGATLRPKPSSGRTAQPGVDPRSGQRGANRDGGRRARRPQSIGCVALLVQEALRRHRLAFNLIGASVMTGARQQAAMADARYSLRTASWGPPAPRRLFMNWFVTGPARSTRPGHPQGPTPEDLTGPSISCWTRNPPTRLTAIPGRRQDIHIFAWRHRPGAEGHAKAAVRSSTSRWIMQVRPGTWPCSKRHSSGLQVVIPEGLAASRSLPEVEATHFDPPL